MSFSSSFCLTNIGSLQLGTSVDFYSDVDNYTTPFQTDILLSNITGNNCPYVLNGIPNGTTTIQLLDVNSSCCVEVPITTFTCEDCNFGFDVYSSVTFNSRIVAGNLTTSCDNNITDYVIEWYNINDLTTSLYVSGLGDEFEQYQQWTFPHPLIGNSSIPVPSGTYVPVIKYIRLNGINYSSTLENGLVQIPLSNCLSETTIIVQPLTCDNGTNIGDYTHLIQFSGSSQGQPPSLLSSTFILSPNTNYFAWRFSAFDVQDTIRITYYGSYYNNIPIVLEYYNVGNDNTYTNYSDDVNPKLVRTWGGSEGTFNKVTCLTGLTRSSNDYLVIDIIPNQSNPKTDFKLYLICLENYDCTQCNDNFLNQSYKILGSSITGITQSCDRIFIQCLISGCTLSDLETSDYYKYTYTPDVYNSDTYGNTIGYTQTTSYNTQLQLYNNSTFCGVGNPYLQTSCVIPSNNNLITFTKDNSGVGGIGNVYMTFSNINDLIDFYNSYNSRLTESGGVQNDPTILNYYTWIALKIPVLNSNPVSAFTETCGDTTTFTDYVFHNTSVVTTGVTGNGAYYMNLTMPTISKQIDYDVCELGCDNAVEQCVSNVNYSSTGNTTNNVSWINNTRNRVNIPFFQYSQISYIENSQPYAEFGSFFTTLSFLNNTIPMSGTNYTIIPELSASTCNLLGHYIGENEQINLDKYQRYLYYFKLELTNPNNINDLKFSTKNISNGQVVGDYFRIWEIQNGVVIYSDPNYII